MSSRMKETMSRLLGTLKGLNIGNSGIDQQRRGFQTVVEEQIDALEETREDYITPAVIRALDIQIELLEVDHQSPVPFFKRFTPEKLRAHPKNLEDEQPRKELRNLDAGLSEGDPFMQSVGAWTTWRWADGMSYRMMWEIQVAPRMGSPENCQTLGFMTKWRCQTYFPVDERYNGIFSAWPRWGVDYYWRFAGGKHPHIKICMHHAVDGKEGVPLRGELLAILTIIATRLGHEDFKNHVIIPVMLVSFMGHRHGRIILSWFDGKRLIVKMSRLFRFLIEDEASIALFAMYLASEVDTDMSTRAI